MSISDISGKSDAMRANAADHQLEPCPVDGGSTPEGPEQLLRPDQTGKLGDVALAKGDDSERDIAQHLGQHSTQAKGDDRSKDGVPFQPRE